MGYFYSTRLHRELCDTQNEGDTYDPEVWKHIMEDLLGDRVMTRTDLLAADFQAGHFAAKCTLWDKTTGSRMERYAEMSIPRDKKSEKIISPVTYVMEEAYANAAGDFLALTFHEDEILEDEILVINGPFCGVQFQEAKKRRQFQEFAAMAAETPASFADHAATRQYREIGRMYREGLL